MTELVLICGLVWVAYAFAGYPAMLDMLRQCCERAAALRANRPAFV